MERGRLSLSSGIAFFILAWVALGPTAIVSAETTDIPEVKGLGSEPYSIASVTFNPTVLEPEDWDADGLDFADLTEALIIKATGSRPEGARALYGAFKVDSPRFRNFDPDERQPRSVTAYALIPGRYESVDLEIINLDNDKKIPVSIILTPGEPEAVETMIAGWTDAWRHESSWWEDDSFTRSIWSYLNMMVATRCGLGHEDLPQVGDGRFRRRVNNPDLLELLSGADSLNVAMQNEIMLGGGGDAETADRPMPGDLEIPEADIPVVGDDIAIEAMAMHVPHECFYAWFPSWDDFSWTLDETDRFGTRLRDMIGSSPVDYQIRPVIERQIALSRTLIAKIFGPQVIESVAFIGADGFVREGAAIGIVFQAKNSLLLKDHIDKQRRRAAIGDKAIVESTETIEGLEVSLLRRPDNRVRSFYVVDGDWHLVTNSRAIAGRFIRAGRGDDPLGASGEFRWGRSKMPLSADSNAFVFLSDRFMRNLTGGRYRIEMTRRALAANRIKLARLAVLAARNETGKTLTLDELIEAGYLPGHFNDAPDGGRIVQNADGEFVCSLRGAAGTFLPVPDAKLDGITASEQQAWDDYRRRYRAMWENLDPALMNFARGEDDEGFERISLDLMQTPYPVERYDSMLQFLCPANSIVIEHPADDVLSAQVSISAMKVLGAMGGGMMGRGNSPFAGMLVHTIFGGIQDFDIDVPEVYPGDDLDALLDFDEDEMKSKMRFYAGESPMPQMLLMLGAGAAQADADGYFQVDDFWGRSMGNIHAMSVNRESLEQVTPELKLGQAKRPAQVRLSLSRLDNRKLGKLVRAAIYLAAAKGAANNVSKLNAAIYLLGIAPKEAQPAVEHVLNAKLICPLGGRYIPDPEYPDVIIADAFDKFEEAGDTIPDSFKPELFDIFRGGLLEFGADPNRRILQVHIEYSLDD